MTPQNALGTPIRSLTKSERGWIRHAQSRSAYPAMFEARDVPGGVDRAGVVCLAITVLRGADLSPLD
jgi:hypothetical protein